MMQSTLKINADQFEDDAKKMIVLTTSEAAVILASIEALEQQAETLKAIVKSCGFDGYVHTTNNVRTVAKLGLTIKQGEPDA